MISGGVFLTDIAINFNDEPTMHFQVDNEYIDLNNLKKYIPNAVGLTYLNKGHAERLEEHNNKLYLHPGVYEYEVVLAADSIEEIIRKYFSMRYTYKEIYHLLLVHNGIQMNVRSLRRILNKLGLKRKNIVESSLETIIAAVIEEVNGPGMNIGYRSMWQRLRLEYKLTVKQSTVLKILQTVDPDGIEARSRYKLKRRMYKVRGPNHLWHIDGFDKLKKFGFPIHGCVDGFSRKVMWLHWSKSNNDPYIIAHYYLDCIKKHKFLPSIIRADRGSENTIIDLLQMALRHHHRDEYAGERCFMKGKSTANERIEKYWKQLKNHTVDFYINLFKTMQERNILDTSNIVHIECLRYLFGSILADDLNRSKQEWNRHRMRKQGNRNIESGIPNILFYWPEKYGAHDCKKPVDEEKILLLQRRYTKIPNFYDPNVEKLIKMLIPNFQTPYSCEEAYDVFVKITESVM